MARRTDCLKQHQADLLAQCHRLRASRAQSEADHAAVGYAQARQEFDLVSATSAAHAEQAEQGLRERYADLRHEAVDVQRLLSVRAYEQQMVHETALHADRLAQSKRGVEIALELQAAADLERLVCVRKFAKAEQLQRIIASIRTKDANQILERSTEDDPPRRRQLP